MDTVVKVLFAAVVAVGILVYKGIREREQEEERYHQRYAYRDEYRPPPSPDPRRRRGHWQDEDRDNDTRSNTSRNIRNSCETDRRSHVDSQSSSRGASSSSASPGAAAALTETVYNDQCPVCLDDLDEEIACVVNLDCSHRLHTVCLVNLWQESEKSESLPLCPLCRVQIH